MAVNKLSLPAKENAVQLKINEIIDNLGGGGTATDVQINGTSITSNNVANIVTNSAYNASSNKIATMSDVPSVDSALSSTSTNPVQNKVINSALSNKYDASNPNGYTSNVGTVTKVNNTSPDSSGNVTLSIPAAQIQSDWTQTTTTAKDYIKNKPSLSTVATSGSYNDLTNKPTIPTVNNATLTIQKNGSTVKTFTANASSNVTCNITVPTKTSDITNDSGYTTNVGTVTKVNNTSPDANGNVTLSIPDAQIQSDWNQTTTTAKDYIKNKPTIPSVGNATITITQGGTTKGSFTTNQSSNATIALDAGGGSTTTVKINGTSITSSGVADIKTNGTYNSSSNKIATMSDLPTVPTNVSSFTNDSGYITGINSTDVTTALGYTPESTSNKVTSISSSSTDTEYPSAKSVVELLKTIYPVGAIFIGTTATCPMSALFGTWTLVAEDRCLQGSSTNHSANTTVAAGLPNIEGVMNGVISSGAANGLSCSGAFTLVSHTNTTVDFSASNSKRHNKVNFSATDGGSTIYGQSDTVQPPAYVVNVWRRTA